MAGAAGCKQGLGQRCEQNSDCSNGLLCDHDGRTTAAEAGMCYDPNARNFDAGMGGDIAITNDAEVPDTAPDQADDVSSSDASDATPADDGGDAASGSDAATDAGGTDAGAADAPVD
jgi:hypothetical protein